MQLFYSGASPYVRKVVVCAVELGLADRIERVSTSVTPTSREAGVVAHNPLGKIPTLVTDDGVALYDSRVICEYLDNLGGGGRLFPRDSSRWAALVEQATADGLVDAALLIRYEGNLRPEPLRWSGWVDGQTAKLDAALDQIEGWAPNFGARINIGTIAIGCALGWLEFRFGNGWRDRRSALAEWFDAFAQRPAMVETAPRA